MDNQHKSRQLRERLSALEQLTNNPLYVDFKREASEKLLDAVNTITELQVEDIKTFFIREQLLGGLSELKRISNWFDDKKDELEEEIKQLTEDKQQ